MPDTIAEAVTSASEVRSMTGFAPVSVSVGPWQVTGDIRAVNGRGLDLRFRVPDWIDGLEPALRKRIQSEVARGSVTVAIRVQRDEATAAFQVNDAALGTALETIGRIEAAAMDRGVSLRPTNAADVAAMRGVLEQGETVDDTGPLREAILADVDAALAVFDADRVREGRALTDVLVAQVHQIETLVAQAREALGDRAEAARSAIERALKRITEKSDAIDEARLAQELALMAVKADVAEELDRLDAHVTAARDLVYAPGPKGRKLDFLMQEFNREANTLCSKAQSTALTSIGLELKTVIDQMREQVQNIE